MLPTQEIAELDKQMALLEVKMLRAQLSSHFIFNSLSALHYFILLNDTQTASRYLGMFSKLLRRLMADSQHDFVRLSDEITTTRLYLETERIRFDKAVRFECMNTTDLDDDSIWLPSLLLHSYVETVLWHDFVPLPTEGLLRMHVSQALGRILLRFETNGHSAHQTPQRVLSAGHAEGWQIAEERVALLNRKYDLALQIEIEPSTAEKGTCIQISFNLIHPPL